MSDSIQGYEKSRNARLNAFLAREIFAYLRAEIPDALDADLITQVAERMHRRDRFGRLEMFGRRDDPPSRGTVARWVRGDGISLTANGERIPSLLARTPKLKPWSEEALDIRVARLETEVKVLRTMINLLDRDGVTPAVWGAYQRAAHPEASNE